MSDPLAEAIAAVIETEHRWRSAPLMIGVESRTCACGITFATIAEHHRHVYEQIAAAARAHIGDEIAARGDADQGEFVFEYAEGYMYAFDIAEQIARGETT